ncbi:transposase [Leptospira weilii serovar Ranarum str. ICFT]|uniref:Transposase n=1 Tax=Leptospira weilii serovar Ranarum str. ICFT TaxID=1218598 RepID=N1WRL5_9LEPT|nr:transposase [Leptospira weilii]EMY79779.1 transposase [Leptospira weilii serovar Ranarum str. ICFT]
MNKRQKLNQLREESSRQLRRFSEPLKRQIVSDIETKVTTIAEVSREYSVTRNSIYKWIYSYSKNRKKGVRTVIEEESVSTKLEALKAKIKELESVIGQKQMKIDFQEKMIEFAEKEYSVDIKKNLVPNAALVLGRKGRTENKNVRVVFNVRHQ